VFSAKPFQVDDVILCTVAFSSKLGGAFDKKLYAFYWMRPQFQSECCVADVVRDDATMQQTELLHYLYHWKIRIAAVGRFLCCLAGTVFVPSNASCNTCRRIYSKRTVGIFLRVSPCFWSLGLARNVKRADECFIPDRWEIRKMQVHRDLL